MLSEIDRLSWKFYKIYHDHTDAQPELKLNEEVVEFLSASTDEAKLEEAADVAIVLVTQLEIIGFDIFDLMYAMESKLKINIDRTWEKQPDGTIKHI